MAKDYNYNPHNNFFRIDDEFERKLRQIQMQLEERHYHEKGMTEKQIERKTKSPMEGLVITTNGAQKKVLPGSGIEFSLKEMYHYTVSNTVDIINLQNEKGEVISMVMNEEGKIKKLPVNNRATNICRRLIPGFSDVIHGPVLLYGTGKFKVKEVYTGLDLDTCYVIVSNGEDWILSSGLFITEDECLKALAQLNIDDEDAYIKLTLDEYITGISNGNF